VDSLPDHNGIMMTLYGEDISQIFKRLGKFSKSTAFKIGLSLLNSIKLIHEAGFIHGDIKPSNIVTGLTNQSNIHIIDFGLSEAYLREDGSHKSLEKRESIKGTLNFCSVQTLRKYSPCRKDDMESLVYVLAYLINGGLPWTCTETYPTNTHLKKKRLHFNVIPLLGQELTEIYSHIQNLAYEQCPDYAYISKIMQNWL
jgi:casein kinase 1